MNWNLSMDKLVAGLMGGLLIPIFEGLYGEGQIVFGLMCALVFFIVLDWLSGIRAAKKDKTYASHYGIDGVFRTFFMLLLPAGGHLLDNVMGLPGVLFGILAVGLLSHIIKSMTANAIRAGWGDWLPINVLDLITQWVQSEIESKVARARQRLGQRGEGQ